MSQEFGLVIVGASWGGLHALSELIRGLPADFRLPIAVVQHRSRDAGQVLNELLQDHTSLPVCEVEDKVEFQPGKVYVAPPDYHLLVEHDHFSLTVDEPVRFSRPSIDVAFASAAETWGPRTVGIVLTGANADGAEGLKLIAERGGLALVQKPDEAECPIMPEAAIKAVPSALVLSLSAMPRWLARLPVAKQSRVPRSA